MRKWWVEENLSKSAAGKYFQSLDSVFSLSGEVLSDGLLNRMTRVEIDGTIYYVKLYFRGGRRLRRWLGQSRLETEWLNLQRFREWGLPCPEILAYGIEKRGPFYLRGALLTSDIPNAPDLVYWVKNHPAQFENDEWLRTVSGQVAAICRTLHSRKFAHGDLKWRNLLVSKGENPRVFCIDCPDGRFWRQPFLNYRIIKDLACLDKIANKVLSKTQRLRFYLDYRQEKKLTPKSKKQIHKILRFFLGRE